MVSQNSLSARYVQRVGLNLRGCASWQTEPHCPPFFKCIHWYLYSFAQVIFWKKIVPWIFFSISSCDILVKDCSALNFYWKIIQFHDNYVHRDTKNEFMGYPIPDPERQTRRTSPFMSALSLSKKEGPCQGFPYLSIRELLWEKTINNLGLQTYIIMEKENLHTTLMLSPANIFSLICYFGSKLLLRCLFFILWSKSTTVPDLLRLLIR